MSESNHSSFIARLLQQLLESRWVLTSLILLLALLMIIPNIGGGLWEDEFITYKEAVLGDPVALTGKPATILDIQPMLAKLGNYIAGDAWGIRIPSIIFGLGTIFLIGRLANDLFGKEVKYLAMIIATFSPILIEFSGEGRPYTALAFWGVAFLYLLNRQMQKESVGNSFALAAVSILGLLTRLTFLGQLAIGGVFYLLKKRKLTVYSIAIIAVVAPFMIRSVMEVFAYDAISTKLTDAGQPVELLNFTVRTLFSFTYGYNTFSIPDIAMSRNIPIGQLVRDNLWAFIAIFIVALGLLAGFILLAKKQLKNVSLLLAFILVPSVFTVLMAQTGYTVIREKFLIAALGAYLILIAAVFKELLRFKIGYLVVGLYFSVIALGFYNLYFHADTHSRRMMIPELNDKLMTDFRSKDDVLVSYTALDQKPNYYSILDQNIHSVIVYDHATDNAGFSQLAERLTTTAAGNRIFFIDDTTRRQLNDSEAVMLKTLQSRLDWKREKFGRNLSLYIFEQ